MWLKLTNIIDNLIDGINMYRLLMYYLIGLIIAAIFLSAAHDMNYSPIDIALTAVILVAACWGINKVLARIFDAPVNPDSPIITGLILTLIIPPTFSRYGFLFMLAAAGLAMGSKYLLTIKQKHIFNPAAIAVVLTAWGPRQSASWWIGTAVLLPFVVIGGIFIVRKLRHESMVVAFLLATTISTAVFSIASHVNVFTSLSNMILTSAAFFLGFVMLTEPYTSPPTRGKQITYAVIVGVLLAPQFHIGHYYTTPEVSLVIGNIFAYLVSSKAKLTPILVRKAKIAANTIEFAFNPGQKLAFQPGQYMEWTIPHTNTDSRGTRRFFTLASSPTEDELLLGVRFYDKGSSYKSAMLDIDRHSQIAAAQVAGDFTMPSDKKQKLAFIAGGIGVTPYRSMIKYMLDSKESRDVKMIYGGRSEDDFAYLDVFEQARKRFGIDTTYVVSGRSSDASRPNMVRGTISEHLIKSVIPDYSKRLFYISGPHSMVVSVEEALLSLGVAKHNIKTDFFSGYA